ncbi:hypothetical protein OPIT5_11810 [Opitutaceae bacterium TAV5]|nr:hypothetical protein OPIT5_11810 [Opitutaceae bacterium TAV5]
MTTHPHLQTDPCTRARRAPDGFTLVELLTVITIIGILAAIILPVTGKVRDAARAAQCRGNVRQIALAFLLNRDDNRGAFPDAGRSGNIDGWIEKLRETWPALRGRGAFACPADNTVRKDPEKEKRSYSINRNAVVDFNLAKKKWYNPERPSQMILLAERVSVQWSVIPNDGTPSTGCMEIVGSPDAAKLHMGRTATAYGFFDGHVEIIKYDVKIHDWGKPWHTAHWNKQ